jgi:glycosyltransferase involved in cell wall biosynthesis
MPTPPITLIDVVKSIKKRSGAKLYMILRDIHPQSSASLGEIRYKWMVDYLYRRSDLGYRLSDIVGCMSPANISFIKKEHDIPSSTRCTVLYNWMNFQPYKEENFSDLRKKYNLEGKFLVLFGGNLGLGQCVENIADLAAHCITNDNIRFVVIGKGVKKDALQEMAKEQNLTNMIFLDFMPREDYLRFVKSADLGLISIHGNNAAPTCPSKVISYMSLKIPVLALINRNNDYGQILEEKAKAGYWAVASDKERVYELFDKIYNDASLRKEMGENGYRFFCENLTTEKVFAEMIHQMME